MEKSTPLSMEALQQELEKLKARTSDIEDARKDQLSIAIVSGDMD